MAVEPNNPPESFPLNRQPSVNAAQHVTTSTFFTQLKLDRYHRSCRDCVVAGTGAGIDWASQSGLIERQRRD